ncbi:hypothetical protein [Candidatus Methylomirabilis sp.]|uniref:Uncharacterized protein n=1 Tax=Candidatus Methylomirabilis tolerans TaxID=3123416 RepID=A0AAJ1AIH8_9BACT|nr:hypothetical protein [Candidatus Methylomirabilis sp.]
MKYWRRGIQYMIFGVVVALVPCTFWTGPSTLFETGVADAQEIVFVKALEEAEKAIQEAKDFEADIYAPEEFSLALNYLAQAEDEAKVFRSASQSKQDTHLFSARKSGEAVSLLAERAQYQAKVAGTKAIEVKSDREITAIKAQIAESFNTNVNRDFSSAREALFGELGTKEAVRSEARRARVQAESGLRKLGLEGQVAPAAQQERN